VSDADTALHHLFEANRLLREAGERLASTAGQTHARRMVLQAAEGGATVPDIARRLGLHRQGVQRIADELVAEGLGRYDENPRHRLSKLFVVTDQGTAALSAIHRAHDKWVAGIEAEAAEIDWTALRDDLEHLVRVLRDQADRNAGSA
jgi:DNA-binding MarR family transcriptional regulator